MSSESQADTLTLLIERFLLLREQGLSVSIEQLCQETPHLADDVARELEALGKMDQFLDSSGPVAVPEEDSRPGPGSRQGTTSALSRYHIGPFYARGGCSEVYIARDERLDRQVAIKFLRPDTEHLDQYRIRLQREAGITSRLNHPGVVSVHAIGEDHRGLPFYTMRLVEGRSLAVVIDEFHRDTRPNRDFFYSPPARKLLHHFCDVCQTIAFAHSKQVIHRDLKPANIVIGSFGESCVIDWGLARRLDGDDGRVADDGPEHVRSGDTTDSPRLTRSGNALGSPAYMSPEQAAGKPDIGIASDIFNLGATLYSILTGGPPYDGASAIGSLQDASLGRFRRPRHRNARVPRALDAICCKAMQRNPAMRYRSARQMATDVERFLADEPVSAMPDPWNERLRRWVKRRKTLVAAVLASVLVACVLLAAGNAFLLESNRELARREAEAVFLRGETDKALDEANDNLYSQQIALASAEYMKNNPHRALQILLACPQDRRQWEWHHLYWRVTRYRPWRQARGTGQLIRGFAVSPDSGLVAYGDSAGVIHLWDFRNDRVVKRWRGDVEAHALSFSPDGRKLVVGGTALDGRSARAGIQIRDVETGNLVAARTSGAGAFTCVGYSADGQRIATGSLAGGIRVRDAATLVPTLRIGRAHTGPVGQVSFVDAGRSLVSCGADGMVRTWDAQAEAEMMDQWKGNTGGIRDLKFNAEMVVTAGDDKLVMIWKRDSRSESVSPFLDGEPALLVGHSDQVQSVCISPNGKYLASAGLDRKIRIWDAVSREELAVIRQHSSHVRCLGFDASGQYFFSSGDDNCMNAWRVDSLIAGVPAGHAVVFGHGSARLLSAGARQLELWDAATMTPVVRVTDHPSRLLTVVRSRAGKLAAALYRGGEVAFIDTENGRRVRLLDGDASPAYCAAFSRDGSRLHVGHHGGQIRVWEVATGRLSFSRTVDQVVYRMAVSGDGTRLLTGHRDGSLRVWKAADLTLLHTIQAHPGLLLDLAVRPGRDEVATTGKNGQICLWDIASGERRGSMEVGASWLNCMEYTPDGRRLVTGSEHTVTFWDAESGTEMVSFSVDRCVHSLAFSPDGRFLAVAGEDPQVRVWQGPGLR